MDETAPTRDDIVSCTKARSSGPTHPHPSAPDTPPGNLVAGPVAALFDRIRDAASHV